MVGRGGLRWSASGEPKVVAGSAKTKAQGLASKVLPDGSTAEMHRRTAEPGSGDNG